MSKLSLSKERISILLLEGIHDTAIADFSAAGYDNVVRLPKALSEDELIARIPSVHMLGIRSRTQLTERVLRAADRLICVGCFCIGTNQVDLTAAERLAIPVFNAPFSNTRSVAELVLGEIVMLMRGIPQKSASAHRGEWIKSAADSVEVRGKTLGIIGYGHIGTQLGILAEAFGMRVIFHDVVNKLSLGNARPSESLDALLAEADVVSLHVPETPETRTMIGAAQLATMRRGGYLINASRGTVVDIDALSDALRRGHLLGAAIDVFPVEPTGAAEEFVSPLRGLANVILTPHIGGSTGEAQERIGNEVARKLIDYSDVGTTLGAVNFPEVQLPVGRGTRFIHIHKNMPGVLRQVQDVFASHDVNIVAQYLQTNAEIGYVVIDAEGDTEAPDILDALKAIGGTLKTRFLYDHRL
ncbi:MAG: phosphoglycerate dehydrogenase [Azospirillaceae bacterium]|nr:phosphoglycerate dehydrogenase [Azospirillaceae bacterium]